MKVGAFWSFGAAACVAGYHDDQFPLIGLAATMLLLARYRTSTVFPATAVIVALIDGVVSPLIAVDVPPLIRYSAEYPATYAGPVGVGSTHCTTRVAAEAMTDNVDSATNSMIFFIDQYSLLCLVKRVTHQNTVLAFYPYLPNHNTLYHRYNASVRS